MRVASGTRVGLCEHITKDATTVMMLEVRTDEGQILVFLCAACSPRYAVTGDLQPLVKRQIVVGQGGWSVKVEVEAPS